MALRRSPDVAWQKIGDQAIVMDLPQSRMLGLNPTGTLVWTLLEESDEDGLVCALVERFATDEERARDDVRGVLAFLRERRLVVEA
jgi:hypothetical protein